ncbi:TPA: recombinase family protein [Vibrio parahaemolyticus]|nr:recombinase family protein [Vibrio parahaemolyticus]
MTIAYSYLRLSSKRQLGGHGKQRQWDAATRAAEEHGWTLSDTTFQDLGLSAYTGKHLEEGGAFRKFLDAVKSKVIPEGSVLIVENPDRISRRGVIDSATLMLDILRAGIKIYTTFDGSLYEGEGDNALMDMMKWGIQAERGHKESAVKAKRLRSTFKDMRKEAREGKPVFIGKCPNWIRRVVNEQGVKVHELIPEKAAIVKRIFDMRLEGWGTHRMADQFIKEGIPCIRGKHWRSSAIRKILNSEMVIGRYQPHKMVDGKKVPDGDPIEGFYPEVVSKETFFKVKAMYDKPRRGRMDASMINIFRGLIRCACGGSYSFHYSYSNNTRYVYTRCDRQTLADCKNVSFRMYRFEYVLLSVLDSVEWEDVLHDQTGISTSELNQVTESLLVTTQELEDINRKADKLLDSLEDSDEDDEDDFIMTRLKKLRARKKELKEKQVELEEHKRSLENSIQGRKTTTLDGFGLMHHLAHGGLGSRSKGYDHLVGTDEQRVKVRTKLYAVLDRIEVGRINSEGRVDITLVGREGVTLARLVADRHLHKVDIESDYSSFEQLGIPKNFSHGRSLFNLIIE